MVTKRTTGGEGSALIMVMWSIGLLSILVSTMAFDARLESNITAYYRNRLKADYLARSGIEVAEMLMIKSSKIRAEKASDPDAEADPWRKEGARLAEGLAIRGMEVPLGEGVVTVSIVPEPARRNVNLLKEEDWEQMLEIAGLPEDRWPVLVESFLDWFDKDENVRTDGAETDYYSLEEHGGYKAKNGPLDTVGELLLIRGFSEAIVYGGTLASEYEGGEGIQVTGIHDLLTVYGDGKVNVNAAGARVLMTLPGVDELVAGAIMEEREGLLREGAAGEEDHSFKDVSDLFRRVPGLEPGLKRYITIDSAIYRVTAVGNVNGVTRQVWCIVTHSARAVRILRWREGEES